MEAFKISEHAVKEENYRLLEKKHNGSFQVHKSDLKVIIESIAVGILTGIVISLFRLCVEKSGVILNLVYRQMYLNHWFVLIWIAAIVPIGYIIGTIVKKVPTVSGGGIPQVEAALLGKLNTSWWKVILGKFIGSVLSIGSGLSLGIEGPSVQLGAAVGKGFGKLSKCYKNEQYYLISSGTSAGIAAAFNAPLAGIMFALEEINKKITPLIVISAFSAAVTSATISVIFFGNRPFFDFRSISGIPFSYYIYIIGFGVIIGAAGIFFSKSLLNMQKLFAKLKWLKIEHRLILCLMASILIGLLLPQALGEGNALIISLTKGNIAIKLLILLLAGKFIFSIICGASGAPGGIFLPIFAVGALIGCVYSDVLIYFFHINSSYVGSFVILAMAGYFSAIIKAPFTACALVVEMTGSFTNLLPIVIITAVAYITTELLKSKPIYQVMLDKILNLQN